MRRWGSIAAPRRNPARPVTAGGRFIAGDPLRGIAALGIVLFHYAYAAVAHTPSSAGGPVLPLGVHLGGGAGLLQTWTAAIYVFFALSGYLLSRHFLRALAEGAALPSVTRYLRNRLLRVVPLLWVVFSILLLRHGTLGASPGQVAAVYGFAQSYDLSGAALLVGPAWTLNVEMGFYLLLPVAAALLSWALVRRARSPQATRMLAVLGLAAAVALASLAFRSLAPFTVPYVRSLPAMLFSFAPGVGLAALEVWAGPRFATWRRARVTPWALLALAGLLYVLYAAMHTDHLLDTAVEGAVAALASGALLAAPLTFQWRTGGCWRLLDNAPLHWLGQRSYSLYLIHQGLAIEFLWILRDAPDPATGFWRFALLALPASLLAAEVLYRLVELPCARVRRRWQEPAEPAPAAGAALVAGG